MSIFHDNWRRFLNEQGESPPGPGELSDFDSLYVPGKVRLFHYTRAYSHSPLRPDVEKFLVDPQFFVTSRGSYSNTEWKRSHYPRSFYYTDPARKERIITGDLFYADVPVERIYNLRQDPDRYYDKWVKIAHERIGLYRLRNDIEWTEMLEDIADSYAGVYYTLGDRPEDEPVVAYFKPLEVKRVEESS